MLNRIAEGLFWVGRYTERTENHARLIDVNYHMRYELAFRKVDESKVWEGLLETVGDLTSFQERGTEANERTALHFLTFAPNNDNSIYSCLRQARTNVRAVRERIPSQSWDILNSFYLWLKDQNVIQIMEQGPHNFYQNIKEQVALFHGMNDSSMLREKEWAIMQVGKYLERAENTTRILKHVHAQYIQRGNGEGEKLFQRYPLIALLRSLGGYEVFRKLYADDLTFGNVMEFLLLNEYFPRTLSFSLKALETFSFFPEELTPVFQQIKNQIASFSQNKEVSPQQLQQKLLEILILCNQLGSILSRIFREEAISA